MHRIVLRVTHGPRWCAEKNRHLRNGETVVLEAATAEELKLQIALHSAHCRKVVEGDIPDLSPPKPPRARRSLSPKAGQTVAPAAGGPVKTPGAKGQKGPAAGDEKSTGHACPKCAQRFKSAEGLERHFKNSRHNIVEGAENTAAPEA